ncbi:hypothetical protein MRX96_008921 [Rhipicephalus microplus]
MRDRDSGRTGVCADTLLHASKAPLVTVGWAEAVQPNSRFAHAYTDCTLWGSFLSVSLASPVNSHALGRPDRASISVLWITQLYADLGHPHGRNTCIADWSRYDTAGSQVRAPYISQFSAARRITQPTMCADKAPKRCFRETDARGRSTSLGAPVPRAARTKKGGFLSGTAFDETFLLNLALAFFLSTNLHVEPCRV